VSNERTAFGVCRCEIQEVDGFERHVL
jgi:hypothetical protein